MSCNIIRKLVVYRDTRTLGPAIAIKNDTGDIGIGTTGPAAKLDITGGHVAMDNAMYLKARDSGGTGRNLIGADSSNNVNIGNDDGWNNLIFQTGSSEKMRIRSDGHVGIGSTNPMALLELQKDSLPGIRIKSTGPNVFGLGIDTTDDHKLKIGKNVFYGSGAYLTITPDGKVGIGTTSPNVALAVNGTIEAKDDVKIGDLTVPDYVFEPNYNLRSLSEIQDFIKAHKHLPDVPSAADATEKSLKHPFSQIP